MERRDHPQITWEADIPPGLSEPVLVLGLEGWIDAGFGGATAVGTLKAQIRTHRLARFDTDELLDQRARRPVMRLVDGVNSGLRWPRLQLRHGRDATGQDVLVLTGPEPDYRWRQFCQAVVRIATGLDVRMVVGLGAFPAPWPHTRPLVLSSTATTRDLADQIGHLSGTFDVPAGVHAALEQAFGDEGIPAVGIWARVPHYVAAMMYPAAPAALLDALRRLSGLDVDTAELHTAATAARQQIDALVANNPEHVEMVRKLEEQLDATGSAGGPGRIEGPLPTGDELAAELERYLRDQPGGDGPGAGA
jgi:proteasome assembly chaperone (PAC2) family protein